MRKYAFTSANTAGEVMTRNSGAGPGFDLLRIVLSLFVILLHSFHVSYPSTIYLATNWSAPIWASILPIFFSLSGFLVAGSAVRSKSLKVFLSYRVLRIVPALSVEVTSWASAHESAAVGVFLPEGVPSVFCKHRRLDSFSPAGSFSR